MPAASVRATPSGLIRSSRQPQRHPSSTGRHLVTSSYALLLEHFDRADLPDTVDGHDGDASVVAVLAEVAVPKVGDRPTNGPGGLGIESAILPRLHFPYVHYLNGVHPGTGAAAFFHLERAPMLQIDVGQRRAGHSNGEPVVGHALVTELEGAIDVGQHAGQYAPGRVRRRHRPDGRRQRDGHLGQGSGDQGERQGHARRGERCRSLPAARAEDE